MGQYWFPVNFDKKEYFDPHEVGSGLKIREQMMTAPGSGAALLWLLSDRWQGDRVALIGDDNDKDSPLVEKHIHGENPFTDISAVIAREIEEVLGGKYTQSDSWAIWNDEPGNPGTRKGK